MSNELWSIYLAGPDDLVAMPSKAVAEAVARNFNGVWERYGAERGHDVHAVAHVEPWMHGKEAHTKDLREHFYEYADLVLDEDTARFKPAQAVEAVGEAITEVACRAYYNSGVPVTPPVFEAMRAALTAALAHPRPTGGESPDPTLCEFYSVTGWLQLMDAMQEHILRLQDAARRNVKPFEDTFPATLLPEYLRDTGLIDADQVASYVVTAPSIGFWTSVRKHVQAASIAENHLAAGVLDTTITRTYAVKPAPTGEQAGEAMLEPPLAGRWHHGKGFLCCGTFRVAREDWEAGVCAAPGMRTEVFDWICSKLNAHPRPGGVPDRYRPSDAEVRAWCERHDIADSYIDAWRTAIDDARSMHVLAAATEVQP